VVFYGVIVGTKKPGVQLKGQTPSLVGVGRETVRGTASDKIEIIFDLLIADWVIRWACEPNPCVRETQSDIRTPPLRGFVWFEKY
jgi:hypothetical protein